MEQRTFICHEDIKLRDLLKTLKMNDDTGINVIDGGTTFAVSYRYLSGGWNEILDSLVDVYDVPSRTFILKREDI